MTKIGSTLAVIAAAALAVGNAAAADYPTRPIRLLVPFPAGGLNDVMARLISPKLSDAMGKTWVVDNRGGAAGNVGAEIVVRANPDGHTVLLALSTQLTANPMLYKLPFNVEKDLQPITILATVDLVVVVHPGVQAKTLNEFVALAKQKRGALNYASAGVGTGNHLGAEVLKSRAGFDMAHVAYKGAGPAVAAVIAGETQVMVGAVASTIPYITAGRLRALATTGGKRSRLMPDVPTVAESGYPGFESIVWVALLVPAATPKSIVERIRNEALKALQHADLLTAMARVGLDPETSTQAELAARIKTETDVLAGVIKEAGIRAE